MNPLPAVPLLEFWGLEAGFRNVHLANLPIRRASSSKGHTSTHIPLLASRQGEDARIAYGRTSYNDHNEQYLP